MCSVMPMVEILSYFSKDLPQGMSSVASSLLIQYTKDLPQVTVSAPLSSLVIRGPALTVEITPQRELLPQNHGNLPPLASRKPLPHPSLVFAPPASKKPADVS